ncbi:Os12g0291733, partial [Oryza sativa Japonica Group]
EKKKLKQQTGKGETNARWPDSNVQSCQNRIDQSSLLCIELTSELAGLPTSLVSAGLLATRGLVGDEANQLHLPDVVEADDANKCIWICLLGLLELLEHLGGISASEHRQLPHGPVPAIIVPRRPVVLTVDEPDLTKLEARHPFGPEQVLDLLQEVLDRERWQVRQGLKLLDAFNRPHLRREIIWVKVDELSLISCVCDEDEDTN